MTSKKYKVIGLLISAIILTLLNVARADRKLFPCPSDANAVYNNCYGQFKGSTGGRYTGEFDENKFNGNGVYLYPSGARYVGEWRNNKQDGFGAFTSRKGEKFIGYLKNNEFNGVGVLFNSDGEVKQAGIWENSEFVRTVPVPWLRELKTVIESPSFNRQPVKSIVYVTKYQNPPLKCFDQPEPLTGLLLCHTVDEIVVVENVRLNRGNCPSPHDVTSQLSDFVGAITNGGWGVSDYRGVYRFGEAFKIVLGSCNVVEFSIEINGKEWLWERKFD